MKEYWFNVCWHGKFLFKTEADTDLERILRVQANLAQRFRTDEGFAVSINFRDTAYISQDVLIA